MCIRKMTWGAACALALAFGTAQEVAGAYTFIVSGVPVLNLRETAVSEPGDLTTGGFSVSATADNDCEARYRTVAHSAGGGLLSTKLRSMAISFR